MRRCRMGNNSWNHRETAGPDIEPGSGWGPSRCDERRWHPSRAELQAQLRQSSQALLSSASAGSYPKPDCELSDRNANRPYASLPRGTSVASIRVSGGHCRPDSSSLPRLRSQNQPMMGTTLSIGERAWIGHSCKRACGRWRKMSGIKQIKSRKRQTASTASLFADNRHPVARCRRLW
jgi:hypothetical protein